MSRAKASALERDPEPKPYHYTGCGLDNVWLFNGFKRLETSYGGGVAIENIEGLHATLARAIVAKEGPLTGKELRFLRHELGLTQDELAKRLNSEEQNIGRYERGDIPIPGPVDRLARVVYSIVATMERVSRVAARLGGHKLQLRAEEVVKKLTTLLDKEPSDKPSKGRCVFKRHGDEWRQQHLC